MALTAKTVPTIQTRLLLLLLILVGLFALGMVLLHHSETERTKLTMAEQVQIKSTLLRKIVDFSAASAINFVYDYSFWDDMVKFVQDVDSTWGRENIDVSLNTFHVTAAWVYNARLDLKYVASSLPDTFHLVAPISAESDSIVVSGNWFPHFFVKQPTGLMEVFGAPIQPTADEERKTQPQGYFFVGRFWSPDYLQELAHNAEAQISLTLRPDTVRNWVSDPDHGIIRLIDTLFDAQGTPTALILGQSGSVFFSEMNRAIRSRTVLLIAFGAILILTVLLMLRKWVTAPLRSISEALTLDSPQPIEKLKLGGGEFSQIAYLISHFFQQNANLINEIVSHERAEESLRKTTSQLSILAEEQRVLLENTRDFIYRHDTAGIFHYVSQSVQPVTGYPPEEWMRHYTTFLTDNPINAKVVEFTERTLREGIAFPPYLVEIHHKAGHRVMLEVSEQPYMEGGKIAGIVGVARDVTQRVQAEEEREVLQRRLEKAERMESLGLLAGGVAHDLNNILGPLVAYPELIMMKLPPDSPHRRQLEIMGKAAQDAADVIQDLLALARRGRYELKPTNVNEVIRQYLESPNFQTLQANHPSVKVTTLLDDKIGAIMGSSSHLMKAIMNLTVNAFEAMPKGGELTITTSQRHLDRLRSEYIHVKDNDYVVISVRDTGIGIAPHAIQKIFQPYYSNKQMGSSGSGLGLAVVHGIVKDQQGYYDVFSEVDKGTEFVLYFPVSQQTVVMPGSSDNEIRGSGTVLVVDDVAEQRDLALQMLASLGYTAVAVATGREAVAYISEHPVDLVMLDMILEKEFDGLDTFEAILRVNPHQKAIIISGFAATDRVARMQELGAGGYIRKPYSRRDLSEALHRELSRRQELSAQHQ